MADTAPNESSSHLHASNAAQTLVTAAVFTALAGLFLVLRLVTRLHIVKNFGPEDWLIVAAFIMSVLLTAAIGVQVSHGEGHHIDAISIPNLTVIVQVSDLPSQLPAPSDTARLCTQVCCPTSSGCALSRAPSCSSTTVSLSARTSAWPSTQ